MNQNFDFTIAVSSDGLLSLDKEMRYIKSALLYADSIKLISPVAHTFFELTNVGYLKNEKRALMLVDKVLPFIKISNLQYYEETESTIIHAKDIINSKLYNNTPIVEKLKIRKGLNEFVMSVDTTLRNIIGDQVCEDISFLVKNKNVNLETFDSSFDDIDDYVMEYFKKLEKSISNSYPLFDEQSNDLMGSAISEGIININDVGKHKATHAGLADRLILNLPSFEFAKVDEILDIRKELENPLMRFRSKTIEYTESIQTLPWDKDFEDECYILYNKEIVPSILEIDEMVEDNNIFKNLGVNVLADQSMLTGLGGLALSVAGAGAITSFSNAMASNKAMLTTGGAWAISKIASTYSDYKAKEKEIERKDLYFYYKAGRNLIDEKYRM